MTDSRLAAESVDTVVVAPSDSRLAAESVDAAVVGTSASQLAGLSVQAVVPASTDIAGNVTSSRSRSLSATATVVETELSAMVVAARSRSLTGTVSVSYEVQATAVLDRARSLAGVAQGGAVNVSATLARTRTLSGSTSGGATPVSATFVRTRSLAASPGGQVVPVTATMVRTRSLVALRKGERLDVPIEVFTGGPVDVPTTGWSLDATETSLGAFGIGAFWFKVETVRRTIVTVTNAYPTAFVMTAFTLADQTAPVSPSNMVPLDQGTALSVVALSAFYVMVDVQFSAGTIAFNFTYEAASQGSISLYVASESGGSATDATVTSSPAALSANVSATSDVTAFDVVFDGNTIMSNRALSATDTWSGAIPIPSRPAGTYDLYVHGDGADVDSNVVAVTILRSVLPTVPLPNDPPARVPAPLTGRWMFVDVANNVLYAFPLNPQTASSTNTPRNHSVESTTSPTSFIVYEGSLGAKSFTFGGVLLDEDMYSTLSAWSRVSWRVWLVDHNMVAWQVVPQKFDVRPRTHRLNPWIQDYEFTVLLLKGPMLAVIV